MYDELGSPTTHNNDSRNDNNLEKDPQEVLSYGVQLTSGFVHRKAQQQQVRNIILSEETEIRNSMLTNTCGLRL